MTSLSDRNERLIEQTIQQNEAYTKAHLVEDVAWYNDISAEEARHIVDSVFLHLFSALTAGRTVHIPRFGTFRVKSRMVKVAFSKSPSRVRVVVIQFEPAKVLKSSVKKHEMFPYFSPNEKTKAELFTILKFNTHLAETVEELGREEDEFDL